VIDLQDELDFEIRIGNLPGPKGFAASTKLSRADLIKFGDLMLQFSAEAGSAGISLELHDDDHVSLSCLVRSNREA
jgi:hypothetical protein